MTEDPIRPMFSSAVGGEAPLSPEEARAWLDEPDQAVGREAAIEAVCRWFGGTAERTLWLRYGRSALAVALDLAGRARGGAPNLRLALPAYTCAAVVATARARGAAPVFYPLGEDLAPKAEAVLAIARDAGVVLTCAYFGAEALDARLAALGPRLRGLPNAPWVIEDRAMAFPQPIAYADGGRRCDFALFSLRKSYPVPDGAALVACSDRALEALSAWRAAAGRDRGPDGSACIRAKVMAKTRRHDWLHSGRLVDDPALNGVADSTASEALIDRWCQDPRHDGRRGSAASAAYVMGRDRAADLRRVRSHAGAIVQALDGAPSVSLPLKDCAGIAVPLLVRDRDRFRDAARSQGLFLPVHWPPPEGVPAAVTERAGARRWYAGEIGLPSLATASPDDIEGMIARVRRCLGERP